MRFAVSSGSPHEVGAQAGFENKAQIVTSVRAVGASRVTDTQSHFLDRRFDIYNRNSTETAATADGRSEDALSHFLKSSARNRDLLASPSSVRFMATQIARWVFDLLMKPVEDESEINIPRSLADVSFDSLAAVELRSWWRRTFALEISVLEIMSFTSFAALGEHAIIGLISKLE